MTFKNIFGNGGKEAGAAEESARDVHGRIPGARPEWEGVDPELFDGIPEVERDPKLVRETSPEALKILGGFVAPLFGNTRAAATEQRAASEDPGSTTDMASSTRDEASGKVTVEVEEEDQPSISDQDREELRKDNERSTENVRGFDRKPTTD
ncbi:hypothetical protein [Nocardiopsis sp. B62]|uniref:hypothetical protein n=1 Tax=Nocardiopsis sp. B62 TaxID=2824874 RepID=UPI001B39724A|nr:hypothetical protein [Nocardiopsis sp. B62]MBQ1084074.1 hypothetical protein [Nocardiopsis sp. B62]